MQDLGFFPLSHPSFQPSKDRNKCSSKSRVCNKFLEVIPFLGLLQSFVWGDRDEAEHQLFTSQPLLVLKNLPFVLAQDLRFCAKDPKNRGTGMSHHVGEHFPGKAILPENFLSSDEILGPVTTFFFLLGGGPFACTVLV